MGFVRRCALFLAVLGCLAGVPSCTPEPDNDYEPVSDACLSCLSEQKQNGCKTEFDACEGVASCDDYVVCQLMGRCFEREPATGCEQELGCNKPSNETGGVDGGNTQSPRDLAREVESCARSTCATICGFAEE